MKSSVTMHRGKLALVCGLGLIALALGIYAGWLTFQPHQVNGHAVNTPPPATLAQIELPDIEKNLRHGTEWLGKVVVVNHWATWCPPCREEIPLLIEYQREHGAQGVQIIGIAHDLLDTARAYSDSIGINYPSLVAITGGGEIMQQQGNAASGALPFTAFFDRQGNLAATQLGKLSPQDLQQAITPLL